MKTFQDYLKSEFKDTVDEGLIRNALSAAIIMGLDADHIKDGLMNMYDYICDKSDINLFYQDFPMKEVILWKTLYKMYEKGVIYIFDIGKSASRQYKPNDQTEEEQPTNNVFSGEGLIKPDIKMRRELRNAAKGSRVGDTDIDISKVDEMVIFTGSNSGEKFVFTLNKTSSIFKKLFNITDYRLIQKMMKKIADPNEEL